VGVLGDISSRIWDVLRPRPTPWSFVTSSGSEAAVGTPLGKLISGGLAGGTFYLQRDGEKAIHELLFGAVSIGLGVGTPVSAAHSEFEWPAQGWGKIWELRDNPVKGPPNSFMGSMMMYGISGSASPLVSSGLGAMGATLIFLGSEECAVPTTPQFFGSFRYVGIIYGSFMATPGAGITAYLGSVVWNRIRG
jgi:hypothetical protein